jgi:hypothetical protein
MWCVAMAFKVSFSNCQNLTFQTVKISLFKLSKFPFSNCQILTFQTVKFPFFELSKFPFSNCQNLTFQTVKIYLSKLSKFTFPNCQNFPFQTVKISLFKLSKFPFSNCQNLTFQTAKIWFKVSRLKSLSTTDCSKMCEFKHFVFTLKKINKTYDFYAFSISNFRGFFIHRWWKFKKYCIHLNPFLCILNSNKSSH